MKVRRSVGPSVEVSPEPRGWASELQGLVLSWLALPEFSVVAVCVTCLSVVKVVAAAAQPAALVVGPDVVVGDHVPTTDDRPGWLSG